MPPIPPDWQLPPGVSRGLWQYFHDHEIARSYDAGLEGSVLATVDLDFVHDHCPPPGRLIDLGCGTGRLLLHLARRGHRVVGVDLSPAMLQVAGAKAAAQGLAIDLVQANLVDLACFDDGAFDHAACLFSTLGMVQGAEQRSRVVHNIQRLLRPGGVFVLHVHNRWFNVWQPRGWRWLLGDLWKEAFSSGGCGDRNMPAHGTMPALVLHLFTRLEAVRMLRAAGFIIRQVRPVSLRPAGKLGWPRWFGWLRTYGYMIAAVKR